MNINGQITQVAVKAAMTKDWIRDFVRITVETEGYVDLVGVRDLLYQPVDIHVESQQARMEIIPEGVDSVTFKDMQTGKSVTMDVEGVSRAPEAESDWVDKETGEVMAASKGFQGR